MLSYEQQHMNNEKVKIPILLSIMQMKNNQLNEMSYSTLNIDKHKVDSLGKNNLHFGLFKGSPKLQDF